MSGAAFPVRFTVEWIDLEDPEASGWLLTVRTDGGGRASLGGVALPFDRHATPAEVCAYAVAHLAPQFEVRS